MVPSNTPFCLSPRPFLLLALTLVFTISCASVGGGRTNEAHLVAAVDAFNTSFRWQDFKAAAEWVAPPMQAEFWTQVDRSNLRLRILDYQVRNVTRHQNGLAADVALSVRYYFTDSPNLQTTVIHQEWHYLEKEKRWEVGQTGYQALLSRY